MDGNKTYGYDATDQLTTVMHSGSVDESFTYDGAGNRTGGSYGVTTGNRITADGTYTYSYDTNGNTLQRTKLSNSHVQDFTWDYRNRLTEVKERTMPAAQSSTTPSTPTTFRSAHRGPRRHGWVWNRGCRPDLDVV